MMNISDMTTDADYVRASFEYAFVEVDRRRSDNIVAAKKTRNLEFRTQRRVNKVGVMLAGLGGNNGSTVAAGLIANREKLSWRTRTGTRHSNWYGSLMLASTMKLGIDCETGEDVYVPLNSVLPTLNPDSIVLGGWDISSAPLGDAMRRAQVLDIDLQDQLYEKLQCIQPLAGIFNPDFVAANQMERADNVLHGSLIEQVNQIRSDIRMFREKNDLDTVIVVWTATTERFTEITEGIHDTEEHLMKAIESNHSELAPSTLYATAAICEKCSFINGSPQNTLIPALIDLANKQGVFIGGDDFKSGQTKLKSVLVDFLISAGLKPVSIVSYNHLGNNDGKNLSSPKQFRSKQVTKSTVVDDIVNSNQILYGKDERPDHCVVIKYIPSVGDSKRAMDEYTSEIFMGGLNTISVYNVCEDSLLASPIIIDLIILTELCMRIEVADMTKIDGHTQVWEKLHSVLSLLSYLCKAPVVPSGTPVVNSLFAQRCAIVNFIRACVGLPAESHMMLESRVPSLMRGTIAKPSDSESITRIPSHDS